jgi:iron complex transport system substrate-binding protein
MKNDLRLKTIITVAALCAALLLMLGGAVACGSGGGGVDSSVLASGTGTTQAVATVTITDQAGRQVTIPETIHTVWCNSPIGTNLMFTLAPDMLVGWNVTPTASEKQFIPEKYRSVVGMGGWYGKNTTGNVEEIIKRAPDVVLDLGTIDASYMSEADRIQGLLNIPVIMVDGTLAKTADTYRYLGKLLGVESRAEELAQAADRILQRAQANTAKIPDSQRVSVYYAEGGKGLNTDPQGSQHTEVLDFVGVKNIAQVPAEQSGYGMSPVSLEQVIAWDPAVILVASDPANESQAYDLITNGGSWANISAVKNKQVYQIPHGPFDWFDRPPCVARLLGVEWLGDLLYPDVYKLDIRSEVKAFYELFYQHDLTDEQLNTLMVRALPADEGSSATNTTAATTETTAASTSTVDGTTMVVKGLVDNPVTLTVADLQKMTLVQITADHPKLGTQNYTGVRFGDLMTFFKVQPGATEVNLYCTDSYIANIPIADIKSTPDALLAIDDDGTMDAVMPGMHGKAWARDIITMEFR